MKKENKMGYYLKKHWKINTLAVLLQVICAGLTVLTNLAMIEMTQGLIELDLHCFVFWITVDLGIWLLMIVLDGAGNWAMAKAKRAMNNRLRRDTTASLLAKSHQEYHSKQSGEYLSQFSNDINQIENLDVVASGGIPFEHEIEALRNMNMYAAIVGKAIYTGKLDLERVLAIAHSPCGEARTIRRECAK